MFRIDWNAFAVGSRNRAPIGDHWSACRAPRDRHPIADGPPQGADRPLMVAQRRSETRGLRDRRLVLTAEGADDVATERGQILAHPVHHQAYPHGADGIPRDGEDPAELLDRAALTRVRCEVLE